MLVPAKCDSQCLFYRRSLIKKRPLVRNNPKQSHSAVSCPFGIDRPVWGSLQKLKLHTRVVIYSSLKGSEKKLYSPIQPLYGPIFPIPPLKEPFKGNLGLS